MLLGQVHLLLGSRISLPAVPAALQRVLLLLSRFDSAVRERRLHVPRPVLGRGDRGFRVPGPLPNLAAAPSLPARHLAPAAESRSTAASAAVSEAAPKATIATTATKATAHPLLLPTQRRLLLGKQWGLQRRVRW